jgi:hypothetical protein
MPIIADVSSRLFCRASAYNFAASSIIFDAYLAPNLTLEEVRMSWVDRNVDPLRDFSEACREELQRFGKL